MDMAQYGLVASVGFMFDTSLAIGRMVFDGFFEKYKNLKIIASHLGGAVPYLMGRWDRTFECMPQAQGVIPEKPSTYVRESIWYDGVVYTEEVLKYGIDVLGEDKVMYGSDYPHNIGDMEGCLARMNTLEGSLRTKVADVTATQLFGL